MKKMKKINLSILLIAVLFSCKKDDPIATTSPTTSTTDARDVFVGSYSITNNKIDINENNDSVHTTESYILLIRKQGDKDTLVIDNLENESRSYEAVSAGSAFSFIGYTSGSYVTFQGAGSISGASISINYEFDQLVGLGNGHRLEQGNITGVKQ